MIRLTTIIFFLLLLVAQTCFGLEITFKAKASVTKVSVTLADIADFDSQSELTEALASQEIAPAPPPGQENVIQAAEVIRYLTKTLSIPESVLWSGQAAIHVYREGVNIGPDKIQSIISEYLNKQKSSLSVADIRFIPASLPLPFMVPTGELTWQVIPSNPGVLSSSSISIIFSVDGRVRKNIAIVGHIEALAPVAVAASTIERGVTVEQEQIHLITMNIADINSPCLDPREIVGKKANRMIKEGTAIEHAWVDTPPMIARGQTVKIVLNNGELHVSTTGIANTNGVKDQIIKVMNINSKKIIDCRVAAPGLVEVQL